ncbi:MAG: OB-fold nucleic acid binding domain-containing protein [Candidatus Aenigmatarchaeota archaeon]
MVMISDKQLNKISLIITIIGIISLIIFSIFTAYREVKISEINYNLLGQKIQTFGRVISEPKLSKNTLLFIISDENNNKINVVMFNMKEIFINKDDKILIFGKVADYNNELEIIANKIEVIEKNKN